MALPAGRRIDTAEERLGWLLVVATIPAGLVGVGFEHVLRSLFAKPLAAAVFLTGNGLILLAGERLRRRATSRQRLGRTPGSRTTPRQRGHGRPGRQ